MKTANFPSSRQACLDQLEKWLPRAGRYAQLRNYVVPGHPHVSRLSPALRHRLVDEYEVVTRTLEAHPFDQVEKFIQEVYWRRYWKSWLTLRPQVWSRYLEELHVLQAQNHWQERISTVEAGQSGLAIMDHFAKELTTSGYLHNHARMWFAAWWIHQEQLPWQLGADFFMRHLLDGDPASNTLSWRWVAGLQTPGKSYLARQSNLEKYIDAQLLSRHRLGFEQLAAPSPLPQTNSHREEITCKGPAFRATKPGLATGLWVHEDDLDPQALNSLCRDLSPSAVIVCGDQNSWDQLAYSPNRRSYLREALTDTYQRASRALSIAAELSLESSSLATRLIEFAQTYQLTQIITLTPEIGPLHDQIPQLTKQLEEAGIHLAYQARERDAQLAPRATSGFFSFWKKIRREIL